MNIGAGGERYVMQRLIKEGYKIVYANYKSRFGEIDIIAQNKSYIIFVEVKTRGENHLGLPREAVNQAKQDRIIKTALIYLSSHKTDLQPRFDVAEVYLDGNNKVMDYQYFENAFSAEGYC